MKRAGPGRDIGLGKAEQAGSGGAGYGRNRARQERAGRGLAGQDWAQQCKGNLKLGGEAG